MTIGDSGERAKVRLPLLCPVCQTGEAILKYSRIDSAYVVCNCGIRIFIWGTEAEEIILKRVSDYKKAKTNGNLEEYIKSQVAVG